jgi:hypothetical protein
LLIPPNSGAKFGDPTPDGVRILNVIAVEAIQQLEHASLIAPAFWYSGNIWYFGYRSTRAGRTAVEQGGRADRDPPNRLRRYRDANRPACARATGG